MAIFRLQITSIGRGAGRKATAAAAYRAGELIRDERTGERHDFSGRKDVLHREIFLPAHLSGAETDWAQDRATLWNEAERAEHRGTSRVAREFLVTLPSELSATQRQQLARTFSQELADRYKVAVDLAIHEPRIGGDPRNFHAHLLATTREVTASGLGAKVGLDMNAEQRRRFSLPDHSREFTAVRERWATLTNEALREANIDARIDHRAAQGIDRERRPPLAHAAFPADRAGDQGEIVDALRTRYNDRAQPQPRLARAAELDISTEAQQGPQVRTIPSGSQDASRVAASEQPAKELQRRTGRGRDDDLSL